MQNFPFLLIPSFQRNGAWPPSSPVFLCSGVVSPFISLIHVVSVTLSCSHFPFPSLHWRRQGGPRLPPPNRRPPIFLFKTEGLSSLPPAKSGRACYDNPTGRGHFYQMPNTYTWVAYLIEIRKFCSKNLVHKGVNFEAQNALKLTYEHLYF